TTVFLAEYDDFESLTKILDDWCMALAGAKFNINKTEILPIGVPVHRQGVRNNRTMSGLGNSPGQDIPEGIKITMDGEAVRTLGAWVGNGSKQVDVWTRTLDKIEENLNRWERGHPTMEGRRLIVLMVVGGMTQYLTKVQGMPKTVEDRLERRVRKFLWADKKKINVNKETIYAPIEEG
ncbi:hypothetical protein CPB85DRAFT_1193624, partial [Mucidula mucida]